MKNSEVVVGNSSAGVREAPSYAVPTVNIGSRQHRRFSCDSIVDVEESREAILRAVATLPKGLEPSHHFGTGNSAAAFIEVLRDQQVWSLPTQKLFNDVSEMLTAAAK